MTVFISLQRRLSSCCSSPSSSPLAASSQKVLECAAELHVEDRVNDRIEEAVHVPEPDEEGKEHRIDNTDAMVFEEIVTDADGVHDVYGKERHPTQQEHA